MLNFFPDSQAKRHCWPHPFNALISELNALKGEPVVVLTTGDPLWFSVGVHIAREIDSSEISYHPQLSSFQYAAARLGWSLADCETLTIHGRAREKIIPFIQPKSRLLILTSNGECPLHIAQFLKIRGFSQSRLHVLSYLGMEDEAHFSFGTHDIPQTIPDFHVLAVECVAEETAQILTRTTGLPDTAFMGDGVMTKRDIRAATLAKLAPNQGEHLWDIGAGCASVAIEWMRSAKGATATAIEMREDRTNYARQNALSLGVPELEIISGTAPDALQGLTKPDAIFIGGGFSEDVFHLCWDALSKTNRLVVNCVTLESEALTTKLYMRYGGELTRLSIERAVQIGSKHGWKPSMAVTQWSIIK